MGGWLLGGALRGEIKGGLAREREWTSKIEVPSATLFLLNWMEIVYDVTAFQVNQAM